jgi:hypothetical protein
MTDVDLFAYQDTMAGVTRDIHDACHGAEISVLWDDGKLRMVTGRHKVKVWNNLGSVELRINHRDLVEKGNAYKGFLALIAARVHRRMDVS